VRKLLALAATVATIAALSGCAAQNPADALTQGAVATCRAPTAHANVDQIKVSGDLKKAPEVDFATPITADEIETKVITPGTGQKIFGNQKVKLELAVYNGGSKKQLLSTKFDGSDATAMTLAPGQIPDFCGALAGVREGSRVAVLYPPKFAHNAQGIADLGVKATDSLVFVFDILKVYLPMALGDEKALPVGFPAVNVVRASNGTPGITIPKTAAPTALSIATLIQGRGDTVAMGDNVTMHYSGFLWDGHTKFDSSWDKGEPLSAKMEDGGLIKGFLKAVVGQKVGSQIVAVIPAKDGYGATGTSGIPGGATLVFVIDILGIN
jgi:FKBP-type peptidyl-prolyl cis-trans isomerase